jgi:hypothetical protein
VSGLIVCPPHTVSVTHIFDGEEVVTGGDSGQIWIATFADRVAAEWFIKFAQQQGVALRGEPGFIK